MLRKKNRQVHQDAAQSPTTEGVNIFQKMAKRKGLTAVISLLLLVEVIILGTVAWYTRISNVTGMTMDVAEFDFNANYVEQDFVVSVDQYLNVADQKAAPGTGGMVPIRLDAEGSETAASYAINLDFSEMADEFKKKIRFFYYTSDGKEHTIDPANSLDAASSIKGTVAAGAGGEIYEYLYWEWVYELDGDGWFSDGSRWYNGDKTTFGTLYPDPASAQDEFDAFDTNIGMKKANDSLECTYNGQSVTIQQDENADGTAGKLFAYQKAMIVKLNITGVNASPEKVVPGKPYNYRGTTVYHVPASDG